MVIDGKQCVVGESVCTLGCLNCYTCIHVLRIPWLWPARCALLYCQHDVINTDKGCNEALANWISAV